MMDKQAPQTAQKNIITKPVGDMYIPPYKITPEIIRLIGEISEQIGSIMTRLGDIIPSPLLRKKNQIKTIHSSLAIEHNSLSLKQVTDIIDGKRVLGDGRTL